jgi:succinate dehydrogenase hydrophobic anchor subunit
MHSGIDTTAISQALDESWWMMFMLLKLISRNKFHGIYGLLILLTLQLSKLGMGMGPRNVR